MVLIRSSGKKKITVNLSLMSFFKSGWSISKAKLEKVLLWLWNKFPELVKRKPIVKIKAEQKNKEIV